MAPRRLSALADHGRADLGAGGIPEDRLPGPLLLCGAQEHGRAEVAGRGRSRAVAHLREARHSPSRAGDSGGRAEFARGRRRRVRFRLRRDDLPRRTRQGRRDLLPDLGSRAFAPRTREEVSRLGRAGDRQLLRHAELGGLLRRLLRLHSAGRALPDGIVDLLPHQRAQHRAVRAHADHRGRRLVCVLSRGLHGPAARREPAACGRRRADRARGRRDQIFDRAELVPGRCRGQGRHLQFRDQARRLPRRPFEDFVDAGRDGLRHHLEVSVLHPARR